MASEQYNISAFPNNTVVGIKLLDEIEANSNITTPAVSISRFDSTVTIIFESDISGAEKTELDGVVGTHDGVGYAPVIPPTLSDGTPVVRLDAPTLSDANDNKPIITVFPAKEGHKTFFTGAGDDLSPTPPESGRGNGTKLLFDFNGHTAPTTIEKILEFQEVIEVHDGQLFYRPVDNWDPLIDYFDLKIRMPASTVSVNGGGTGNCNLVDAGGYNVIVPAAADGGHDIDLVNNAVPIKAVENDGYWNLDWDTLVITPAAGPVGNINLLDIQIEAYSCRNMPLGHPMGVFDIEAYKTEFVHPSWKIIICLTKASSSDGVAAGWLMLFRKNIT